MRRRSTPAIVGLAAGCLLAAVPSQQPATVDAAPATGIQVEVVDLLTRRPLIGAHLQVVGTERQTITNAAGRALVTRPTQAARFALRASAAGYLGTTETMLSAKTTTRVRIAMPPRDRLAEADELIRSAAAQDPRRVQRRVSSPEVLATPLGASGGLTYTVPKNIDVKMTDGTIVTMDLEEYLKGVLPKEIGTSFPAEAKKAQAVAARTYTISYTNGGQKAICTTTKCQVWSPTHYASTDQAVEDTRSQVAVYTGSNSTYNLKLAGGYFAASCGGATVNSEDGGWSFRPFLRSVTCIENKTGSCSAICQPSTCNNAKCPSSHPTCWGIFGHRIGLCQRGAQSMASCSFTYAQIIGHYYTDTEVANVGSGMPDGPVVPGPAPSDISVPDSSASDSSASDGGAPIDAATPRDTSSKPADAAPPNAGQHASLDGGCSCRTSGETPAAWSLLGLLLLALARRRS